MESELLEVMHRIERLVGRITEIAERRDEQRLAAICTPPLGSPTAAIGATSSEVRRAIALLAERARGGVREARLTLIDAAEAYAQQAAQVAATAGGAR